MCHATGRASPGLADLRNDLAWVVYHCPYRDLNHTQRTKTFRDLASAKRFAADVRSSRPLVQQVGTIRLGDLWTYVMETSPPPEQTTRERYEQNWRLHIEPTLGNKRLREIQAPDVKRWLAALAAKKFGGRSGARTIEQCRALLHHLFEVAVEDGLAAANPVTKGSRKMLPVQERRERRILTLDELHRLAAAMPRPGDRVYSYLMGLGGARIGEPAALRVKDFDGSSITIREAVKGSRSARLGSTKTDKVRRVPVPSWLCQQIEALAKDRLPGGVAPAVAVGSDDEPDQLAATRVRSCCQAGRPGRRTAPRSAALGFIAVG